MRPPDQRPSPKRRGRPFTLSEADQRVEELRQSPIASRIARENLDEDSVFFRTIVDARIDALAT